MTSPLFIFATIKPKPEHYATARAALETLVAHTLKEPGCNLFAVFTANDDPGLLHLFESFKDSQALDHHYEQPYTQRVFEQYQDWLEEPVVVQKLSANDDISRQQFNV